MLRLRALSLDTLTAGLQDRWGVPAEQARLLAHLANGRIGAALSLYRSPELLKQRQGWLEDHHRLLSDNRVKRFAYAEPLAKDKQRLQQALEVSAVSVERCVFTSLGEQCGNLQPGLD